MKSNALAGLALCAALTTAAPALAAPDNPAAIARAQAHVRQNAAVTFFDADQGLVALDTITDADGTEHVRFGRTYRGLRVIGGDLVVHAGADGVFSGLSQTLTAPLRLDTRASLASQGAARRAIAEFTGRVTSSRASLVVFAREVPTLAYEVVVEGELDDQTPSELHVIVDATSAAILDSWDGVQSESAIGTGKSFFSGNVALTTTPISGGYSLKDPVARQPVHHRHEEQAGRQRRPVHGRRQHVGQQRADGPPDRRRGRAVRHRGDVGLLQERPLPDRHRQRQQGRL